MKHLTSTGQEVAELLYDYLVNINKKPEDIKVDTKGRYFVNSSATNSFGGRHYLPKIYQQYLRNLS